MTTYRNIYSLDTQTRRVLTLAPSECFQDADCTTLVEEWEDIVYPAVARKSKLVLCQSTDGWSLHAPGSTDEEIASGDAPYLVSGEGEPSESDIAEAWANYTVDNDCY